METSRAEANRASVSSNEAWDAEYSRRGIPSSYRREPSAAVQWAFDQWMARYDRPPATALDVGCGTGRNSLYLADRGVTVTGFDNSARALEIALRRSKRATYPSPVFLAHDLRQGLPAADGSIDLLVDVFVYKHQVDPETRRAYRAEAARVLGEQGLLLLSLAEPGDEFYGRCPPLEDGHGVLDPHAGVGSVLFSFKQLRDEIADRFLPVAQWRKQSISEMYGQRYRRRLLSVLCAVRT